jgi:hypothetical protein
LEEDTGSGSELQAEGVDAGVHVAENDATARATTGVYVFGHACSLVPQRAHPHYLVFAVIVVTVVAFVVLRGCCHHSARNVARVREIKSNIFDQRIY